MQHITVKTWRSNTRSGASEKWIKMFIKYKITLCTNYWYLVVKVETAVILNVVFSETVLINLFVIFIIYILSCVLRQVLLTYFNGLIFVLKKR